MTHHHLGPYQALDLTFEVVTDDQATAESLGRAFTSMSCPGQRPAVRYEVHVANSFGVRIGDEPVRHFTRVEEVVPWLLWRIGDDVARVAVGPVLHAAAAMNPNGEVFLICGRSNAGKSTLVAGLVMSGWSYITDEAVAWDAHGRVRGWCRAVALSRGSLEMVGALGGHEAAIEWVNVGTDLLVPPAQLGVVAGTGLRSVSGIVLLEGDSEARPLGPSECVVNLARHLLTPLRIDNSTVRAVVTLVEGAQAHTMSRASLPQMVERVADLAR